MKQLIRVRSHPMSHCGNVTSRAAARDFSFGFVDMYLFFDILAIRLSDSEAGAQIHSALLPSSAAARLACKRHGRHLLVARDHGRSPLPTALRGRSSRVAGAGADPDPRLPSLGCSSSIRIRSLCPIPPPSGPRAIPRTSHPPRPCGPGPGLGRRRRRRRPRPGSVNLGRG